MGSDKAHLYKGKKIPGPFIIRKYRNILCVSPRYVYRVTMGMRMLTGVMDWIPCLLG